MQDLSFLETNLKMPLMNLPVRTVVINLGKGKILWSPGSQLTGEQLSSLEGITDIVAPNLLHTGGVMQASQFFPQATVWGPKGVEKVKSHISWSGILTENHWPYQEELPIISIYGMPALREVVAFHKKTKSIIVTDLCFNLVESRGLGAWFILNLFGTYKKFGISKLFVKYIKDKKAFQKSVEKIFEHDFEKIITSHGLNIESNGSRILMDAFKRRGFSFEKKR